MVNFEGTLRIATRGSELALWQANAVRDAIRTAHPAIDVELEVIRTKGDRVLDVPLARIGDRGLFTKEVDEALLDGRAHIAVHSLKDVPTVVPDGLAIVAIGEREDPGDVLLAGRTEIRTLDDLESGARIGTSSLRRRAQLRHLRPDLETVDLRGNLNTRVARLDRGDYDAIILAAAGVHRLGWRDRITLHLPVESWLPAVGQGALGIMAAAADDRIPAILAPLNHAKTATCVQAERAFLRMLEGGCQVPIGALATISDDRLTIDGFVSDLDGKTVLREQITGDVEEPARIGEELAERLLERGAGEVLEEIRRAADESPTAPAP